MVRELPWKLWHKRFGPRALWNSKVENEEREREREREREKGEREGDRSKGA